MVLLFAQLFLGYEVFQNDITHHLGEIAFCPKVTAMAKLQEWKKVEKLF